MKVFTSREFNQDVSQAKRVAALEPVFVTDRGRPTHVLMSIGAFRQIVGQTETMVDMLAMPDAGDVELGEGGAAAWDRQGSF